MTVDEALLRLHKLKKIAPLRNRQSLIERGITISKLLITQHHLLLTALSLSLAACGRTGTASFQILPPKAENPTNTVTATSRPNPTPSSTPSLTPTVSPTPTPDVFASEFPLGETTYRLPLTIRHVTSRTAIVFFELNKPVEGYLFYQLVGGAQGGKVAFSADRARYQITMENLTPGSSYKIRLGISGMDGSFTEPAFLGGHWGPVTAHTYKEDESLRFGVIGDASFGDPITASLVELMAASDLDFVVHTGDVVDETEANADPFDSYANKYYAVFAPLLQQMPVYTVPGNHDHDADIRWQDEPFYYYAFPPFEDPIIAPTNSSQYYAFSRGEVQFIMLDSQVFYGVSNREEQNEWLSDRLEDARFQASIPVFHVSPYSSSSVHRGEGIPVRQRWVPLFEGARVPLVLSGHTHQYERLTVNGITYIVSGGGSAITYAGGERLPESQVFARKSHFVLAELYSDRLDLTSISVDGETLDQFSIALP
jgi:predicted phosphodiesterase